MGIGQVVSQIRPDEHIVRLAVQHLGQWLGGTTPDRLRQLIASDEDPIVLPDPLPLDDLSWAKRGILRARVCVPRPDLYREILRRLQPSYPEHVELVLRLDGAGRWYTRCMERVRGRVLAALEG